MSKASKLAREILEKESMIVSRQDIQKARLILMKLFRDRNLIYDIGDELTSVIKFLNRLEVGEDRKVSAEYVEKREGDGKWKVWFPRYPEKTKNFYISEEVKAKSDLQALGSWLASGTDGRYWHNNIFEEYDKVIYKGKEYTKNEGKLLYKKIVENKDWESAKVK